MAAACDNCAASVAPYTCPRCNRRLCSLSCYRGHGACAEAFYREQVMRELRSEPKPEPSERARMGKALREVGHVGEGGPEVGGPEVEGPEVEGPEGLWGRLSEEQRADFRRKLRSGEVFRFLPQWRPWWWGGERGTNMDSGVPKDNGVLKDNGVADDNGTPIEPNVSPIDPDSFPLGIPGPMPPPPLFVPPLSSFPSPPPSPLLRFQLPNLLYGYAFALSLHNGDDSLLPDVPAAIMAVSSSLRSRRPFCSTVEAILDARRCVKSYGYPQCPLGDVGTVRAVAELMRGRSRFRPTEDVEAALHHVGLMMEGASINNPPPPTLIVMETPPHPVNNPPLRVLIVSGDPPPIN
uniref:Zinc finger HIT-type containing 2 n=1 Tax=Coturnix japonica TaxID=93934 RepID=A0A8C2SS01_COTJA